MTMKPLTQGDEDGLCGLYAITDALTLLFPSRMNEEGRSDVFKVIAKACTSEWPGIIWNGTNVSDMRAMPGAARKYLADSFAWEQPFAHKPFHDFEDFERELKWRIAGDNAFAIVGIFEALETLDLRAPADDARDDHDRLVPRQADQARQMRPNR
jgi:hypothetical protein